MYVVDIDGNYAINQYLVHLTNDPRSVIKRILFTLVFVCTMYFFSRETLVASLGHTHGKVTASFKIFMCQGHRTHTYQHLLLLTKKV